VPLGGASGLTTVFLKNPPFFLKISYIPFDCNNKFKNGEFSNISHSLRFCLKLSNQTVDSFEKSFCSNWEGEA